MAKKEHFRIIIRRFRFQFFVDETSKKFPFKVT